MTYALWGLVFGFVLSAPVGPVNIICLRRALFGKTSESFLIGCGAALGDAFYAGLAAFGLTAIFNLIEDNTAALKLVGGIIMFVFAVRIWRSHPHLEGKPVKGGVLREAIGSLVLTVTNPGVFLGFIGLYSMAGIGQLGVPNGTVSFDGLALVVGVFVGAAVWWAFLVLLVRLYREKINDKLLERINHISAALIGIFALVALGSTLISAEITFF